MSVIKENIHIEEWRKTREDLQHKRVSLKNLEKNTCKLKNPNTQMNFINNPCKINNYNYRTNIKLT